jgi:hypothetical protein
VPDPQQLPLGATCPAHQASAAEAGLGTWEWWMAVREDRCQALALAARQTGRAADAPGGVGFKCGWLPWSRRRPRPPRWPEERLDATKSSDSRLAIC